jgi:hypothetical protein
LADNYQPKRDEKLDLSTAAKFIGKDVSPDTWVLSVRKAANPDGKSPEKLATAIEIGF